MDGPPRRPLSLGLSVQLAGPRSGGSARTAGAESQPHARSFLFLRESSRRPTALSSPAGNKGAAGHSALSRLRPHGIHSSCSSSSFHHCQHLLLSPGVSGPAYQAPPPVCRFPGSQLRVLAFPGFPRWSLVLLPVRLSAVCVPSPGPDQTCRWLSISTQHQSQSLNANYLNRAKELYGSSVPPPRRRDSLA